MSFSIRASGVPLQTKMKVGLWQPRGIVGFLVCVCTVLVWVFALFSLCVCTVLVWVFALFISCVWTVQFDCLHYSVLCVCTVSVSVFGLFSVSALFSPVCLHYSVCVSALFNVSALFRLCVCTAQSVYLRYTVLCICTINLYVFGLFSPVCLHNALWKMCYSSATLRASCLPAVFPFIWPQRKGRTTKRR